VHRDMSEVPLDFCFRQLTCKITLHVNKSIWIWQQVKRCWSSTNIKAENHHIASSFITQKSSMPHLT